MDSVPRHVHVGSQPVTPDLAGPEPLDDDSLMRLGDLRSLQRDFTRFMLQHRFAMEEIVTKVSILRDEFAMMHDRNPIEHVASRLKSPESLIDKMRRKGTDPSFESVRRSVTDIAGVRITCSFVSDVQRVWDLLAAQHDVTVREVRDYIGAPKPNGYRSLHALVEIPVFLSDGPRPVTVEIQLRTIAMDFWASLEHKIHYKYRGAVPDDLSERLREAAESAHALDAHMESLHDEVRDLDPDGVVRLPDDIRSQLQGGADLVPSHELLAQLHHLIDRDPT